MRVMITGGLGFLGCAAAARLQAEGHDVRLMDVRDSGPRDSDYFQGSVLSSADCVAACEGVDVVVHGAAIHQAQQVYRDPLAAIAINVKGTINLFNGALKAGARRFVFMSSAKVYGDPNELPSAEYAALEPKETYALSKLAGEHHLRMNQAAADIEVVIIRPFSVYGPGQNLGSGYVGMVLESLLGERRVDLPGERDYIRDFVHIDDVTRLSVAAITGASRSPVTIMNAGSGEAISLAQLAEYGSDIVGYDLPISFRTPGPETLTRSHACLELTADQFGYRPRYQVREGLADTIEWFMSTNARARKLGTR